MACRSSPPTGTGPESEAELGFIGAAPGQARGAAVGGELNRPLDLPAGTQAVGQPGGEAVAAAVRVADRARERRGPPLAALPRLRLPLAARRARRPDDDARRRVEIARAVALTRVPAA